MLYADLGAFQSNRVRRPLGIFQTGQEETWPSEMTLAKNQLKKVRRNEPKSQNLTAKKGNREIVAE